MPRQIDFWSWRHCFKALAGNEIGFQISYLWEERALALKKLSIRFYHFAEKIQSKRACAHIEHNTAKKLLFSIHSLMVEKKGKNYSEKSCHSKYRNEIYPEQKWLLSLRTPAESPPPHAKREKWMSWFLSRTKRNRRWKHNTLIPCGVEQCLIALPAFDKIAWKATTCVFIFPLLLSFEGFLSTAFSSGSIVVACICTFFWKKAERKTVLMWRQCYFRVLECTKMSAKIRFFSHHNLHKIHSFDIKITLNDTKAKTQKDVFECAHVHDSQTI